MGVFVQDIHPSVFVAASAALYGKISIGEGSSVWPNVVVRCETHSVRVGRMSNLQDFVMIHIGYDHPTIIGDFCSITHHATVHGATVGNHCLIGIGAVIMDGAVIGEGSIVAGGAMVKEGSVFEAGSIIAGIPAKAIRQRESARENRMNAWLYWRNAEAYKRGDHRAWQGPEFEAWKAAKWAEIQRDADLG